MPDIVQQAIELPLDEARLLGRLVRRMLDGLRLRPLETLVADRLERRGLALRLDGRDYCATQIGKAAYALYRLATTLNERQRWLLTHVGTQSRDLAGMGQGHAAVARSLVRRQLLERAGVSVGHTGPWSRFKATPEGLQVAAVVAGRDKAQKDSAGS